MNFSCFLSFCEQYAHIPIVFGIGFYLICALQWYSYRVWRVLFHFHKYRWHIYFLLLPTLAILLANFASFGAFISLATMTIYLPSLYLWQKRQDKPLVFTGRVKRYLAVLFVFTLAIGFVVHSAFVTLMLVVTLSICLSFVIEKIFAWGYEQKAIKRIQENTNMLVVAVTASYGKTSIKNFLAQILAHKYRVYATPRSVNTKIGLILDINSSLPADTQIYVVEAGAREPGDIACIANFVKPHYAIVGKIGAAHLEYFKTIEVTQKTKLELLESPRLKAAFVYENAGYSGNLAKIFGFNAPLKIANTKADLAGVGFELLAQQGTLQLKAPVLGEFNAINIAAAALMALELGMSAEDIEKAVSLLRPVEHRLQRIDAGGKIILDDSFNGNKDGMLAGIELCKTHGGRKVIVTPGLIETSEQDNLEVANAINNVFDMVILSGEANLKLYDVAIQKPIKIILKNKAELTAVLASNTQSGDLIYFANDAPSYI